MFFVVVLSVLFALILAGIWFWRRLPGAMFAATLWLIYSFYELLQFVRLICAGNCSSQLDFFFFWPLLILVTVLALKQSFAKPEEMENEE
jgi:hypothetical protein